MNRWTIMLALVGALGMAAGLAPAQEPPGAAEAAEEKPEFPDYAEDVGGALRATMDQAGRGDMKEFTVVTDEDINEIRTGDIYKNNGSYFEIVAIASKGDDGGEFTVKRKYGSNDPVRTWSRVHGLGPQTIRSRETLWSWFLGGGVIMYPIAFLGLVMIVIAVNSLWVYRREKQCSSRFVLSAREAIERGDVQGFEELGRQQQGLFAGVCRAMVTNFRTSTVDDIKARCEMEAVRQVNLLRIPLKALNFIAVVAPLLGLWGTVWGLMDCFESVAEGATLAGTATGTAAAGKAYSMADGIRVALRTTFLGLFVAVLALLVFFIFNQVLNSRVVTYCEGLTTEFVHELATTKRKAVALARARAQQKAAQQPEPVAAGNPGPDEAAKEEEQQ